MNVSFSGNLSAVRQGISYLLPELCFTNGEGGLTIQAVCVA